jgi:hypothetical protein
MMDTKVTEPGFVPDEFAIANFSDPDGAQPCSVSK